MKKQAYGGSRGSSSSSSSTGRKRYAAVAEKGASAWKQEWGSFMSGVSLKRLRDGSSTVALKPSATLEYANEEGDDSDVVPTFSYLFSSPAERKAEREAKLKQQKLEDQRRRRAGINPLEDASRHQIALQQAEQRGLKLDGMTRKEKRQFLHLTVTEEHQKAQQRAKDFKLHELMDEKIAWYQQGPHPIDLISEKLVTRKAEKKGKRLGLKYNYLLPHASWIAKRAIKRRESLLVGLGRRFVFDDDGQAYDPLRNVPVDITRANMMLTDDTRHAVFTGEATAADEIMAHNEEEEEEEGATSSSSSSSSSSSRGKGKEDEDGVAPAAASSATAKGETDGKRTSDVSAKKRVKNAKSRSTTPAAAAAAAADDSEAVGAKKPSTSFLMDPLQARNSYVRCVVSNREAALAIQKANLSTNFLSSSVVKGPNIGLDDLAELQASPEYQKQQFDKAMKESRMAAAAVPVASSKRPHTNDAAVKHRRRSVGGGGNSAREAPMRMRRRTDEDERSVRKAPYDGRAKKTRK